MTSPARNVQISAFYSANAERLIDAVRARAGATEETIEDACQIAWSVLVRRPDVRLDKQGFAWLRTVATHEAWRLASDQRDEKPAGSFRGPANTTEGELSEPIASDERTTEERALARIEHTERRALLATLKPAEREALFLKGLGYGYKEIAAETGATYTAVNRRISEGRATLRKATDKTESAA